MIRNLVADEGLVRSHPTRLLRPVNAVQNEYGTFSCDLYCSVRIVLVNSPRLL